MSSYAFNIISASIQQSAAPSAWEQYITWRTSRRVLMAPPAGWAGSHISKQLSGFPFKQSIDSLRVEAAGVNFEAMLLRKLRGEPQVEAEEEPQIDDATREHAEKMRKKHAQDHSKKQTAVLTEDPYELLGLGHLRWRATEEQIKKAYRKQVLIHHPDKKGGEVVGEESDAMFKSLTRAHDILSDPRKRREFDSTEPFDDSIPSELIKVETDEQFFSVYAPVFDRNSKWSKVHPVPQLGDSDLAYDKVMEFYDFWMSFRSWRNFAGEDEYNPEDAESREEKRWMERQNERDRKRRKKEELSRVATLVEGAFKRDPRIKRHKQAEKDAKRRAKQDKLDAIRKEREEQERKETEERETREREAKAKAEEETKERQRKANALRDARAKLRKFCRSATELKASTNDVEFLCGGLPVERLRALIKAIQTNQDAQAAFDAEVRALRKEKGVEEKKEEPAAEQQQQDQQQQTGKSPSEDRKSKGPAPWTDDELSLLAQGIARFPGGSPNRWRMIADLVNQKADRASGVKARSVQEIIAKVGEIKGVADKNALHIEDHKHKGVKVVKINTGGPIGGISLRTQIPDLVPVVEQSNGESKANNGAEGKKKAAASTSSSSSSSSSAPAAAAAQPTDVNPADWTQEQQKALEAALKKFPASLGVQRWDSISAAVSGKSKKDCVERYKFIVAQLRGKTGGK
jgi:DnaJ family protein C protein 2